MDEKYKNVPKLIETIEAIIENQVREKIIFFKTEKRILILKNIPIGWSKKYESSAFIMGFAYISHV